MRAYHEAELQAQVAQAEETRRAASAALAAMAASRPAAPGAGAAPTAGGGAAAAPQGLDDEFSKLKARVDSLEKDILAVYGLAKKNERRIEALEQKPPTK
jgi:hypothetical protein